MKLKALNSLKILMTKQGNSTFSNTTRKREKWKCAASREQTCAELEWRESTAPVNSPAFSDLPRINSISGITEDSFSFESICPVSIKKFSKLFATKRKKISESAQKGWEGCPLKQKLMFALWKDITVQEIKQLLASVAHVSCGNPSYGTTGEQDPIVKTSYIKLTSMPLDPWPS
jgi:hypothetical protein